MPETNNLDAREAFKRNLAGIRDLETLLTLSQQAHELDCSAELLARVAVFSELDLTYVYDRHDNRAGPFNRSFPIKDRMLSRRLLPPEHIENDGHLFLVTREDYGQSNLSFREKCYVYQIRAFTSGVIPNRPGSAAYIALKRAYDSAEFHEFMLAVMILLLVAPKRAAIGILCNLLDVSVFRESEFFEARNIFVDQWMRPLLAWKTKCIAWREGLASEVSRVVYETLPKCRIVQCDESGVSFLPGFPTAELSGVRDIRWALQEAKTWVVETQASLLNAFTKEWDEQFEQAIAPSRAVETLASKCWRALTLSDKRCTLFGHNPDRLPTAEITQSSAYSSSC